MALEVQGAYWGHIREAGGREVIIILVVGSKKHTN